MWKGKGKRVEGAINRERAGGKGDTSVGRKKLIRRSECVWEG